MAHGTIIANKDIYGILNQGSIKELGGGKRSVQGVKQDFLLG